jgi:hypothetical protein
MRSRLAIIALLLMAALPAATIKLYLKDGSHQMVREYKPVEDRIRFYSLERSDWEEIPRDLVDLARTERERKERDDTRTAERKAIAEEEAAEREHLQRIARIPEAAGVYFEEGIEMKPLVLAESKLVTDKKRTLLKVMSPIPVFAGKATVEIDGEQAARIIPSKRPDFYIRLSAEENFAIVKLLPGAKAKDPAKAKGSRIVEKVIMDPVVKEMKYEEPVIIEIFRQQLGDQLFKLWPQEELTPGEYAVIQFTPGKVNPQVWDFAIR